MDRRCTIGRRDTPRSNRRSPSVHRAAVCRCRRDSRRNSARECSCSGRMRWQDGQSHGRRPDVPRTPARPFCWGGRAHSRRRYDDGRSRRSPELAPIRAEIARTGPKRPGTDDPSRNIGCPEEKPGSPRAGPGQGADKPKGATSSGSPVSRTTPVLAIRMRPLGATILVHQFPNPSRYAVIGTRGSVVMKSGMTISDARV